MRYPARTVANVAPTEFPTMFIDDTKGVIVVYSDNQRIVLGAITDSPSPAVAMDITTMESPHKGKNCSRMKEAIATECPESKMEQGDNTWAIATPSQQPTMIMRKNSPVISPASASVQRSPLMVKVARKLMGMLTRCLYRYV